jgi:hypothetical protein
MEMVRTDTNTSPPPYVRDVHREFTYAELPPGIGMKHEGIRLKHNRLDVSVLTMVITSLVVFFVPLFNGLIGGVFGGFHARTLKRALAAAVVSSIAVPGFLAVLSFFAGNNSLRIFSGLGFGGWTALHVIGTFIGAVTGAASRPLFSEDLSATPLRRAAVGPTYPTTTSTVRVNPDVTVERVSPPTGPVREE